MIGMAWLAVGLVALWLAFMGWALALPLAPKFFLNLTQRFICPPGTRLEVETFEITSYRPGLRGLVVNRVGQGEPKNVKTKALWLLWVLFLIPSLPIAFLVVWLVRY